MLYFNKIAITYPRRLSAANDFLEFSINQENPAPVSVTGFTQNTVRVFDITNPDAVLRISGAVITADADRFNLTFQHRAAKKDISP